jgi:competence protein ComEC
VGGREQVEERGHDPEGRGAGDTATYREWVRRLDTSDVEQVDACAGQTIDLGDGLLLEVLHPAEAPLDGTASDADNNSVVVRLVYGDFSLLLTGDIHRDAEGYLLDLPHTLDCTVLKVAHHGSRTSSGAEFLDEVSPQLAVLSLAGDSRYGHPHPGVLDRLGEEVGEDGIYLTSEHGTIELITDGDRLWVRTER